MEPNNQPELTRGQIEVIVRPYLAEGTPAGPLPGDVDLRALGIDSVDALEMFAEIERAFDVRLGEDFDFSETNTLDAIAAWIVKKR